MDYAHGCVAGLRQACHDIRQPMAGVLALAGAALTEPDLPDNARDRHKQIVQLAEWQSGVLEHWLWTPGLSAVASDGLRPRDPAPGQARCAQSAPSRRDRDRKSPSPVA